MNKILLMILIFLLVPIAAYAVPVIDFSAISYDFGEISSADKVEHVFEFKNTGDRELVIERVTAS